MKDVKFEDIKAPVINMVKEQEEVFERKKNFKALFYALGIASVLFILFLMVSWKTPEPELPLKEDLVEINIDDIDLGNDLHGGEGEIQPLVKGDFSPMDASPQKQAPASSNASQDAADPITDDNDNEDAPAVEKPPFRPANPSKNINNQSSNPNTPPNNNPPAPPAPPIQKAKVGGNWKRPNGTGIGNDAATNNGFTKQGDGTGKGDRGNEFGKPNGTGTRLTNANLKNRDDIERLAGQSGTNYKGRVTLKLRVDENGSASLISVSVAPVTSSSSNAKNFAKGMVSKMRFPSGADGREALISLDFDYY